MYFTQHSLSSQRASVREGEEEVAVGEGRGREGGVGRGGGFKVETT